MGNVVVLGSLNMDLVVRTERIPRPGETVHGLDFRTVPGGKGANQAAAAARLGARVKMLGRVGVDAFGDEMLANLTEQGVDTSRVQRDPDAPSGTATIVVQTDGENTIIVVPGANGQVTAQNVDDNRDLLAAADYLVMQFEVPLPVVRHAIAQADALGVRVVLNPAPAYAVDADFLKGVYCLVVNETEAEALSGLSVPGLEAASEAALAIEKLGVPVVIVTLGAGGALLLSEGEFTHVPTRPVSVVDTTAAGDAFIGGLVAAWDRGMSLVEGVRYATCAGTLATTVLGAQTSLPLQAAVDAFYGEG